MQKFIIAASMSLAGCNLLNDFGNQFPAKGGGGSATAAAAVEPTCPSDTGDPPPGSSWYVCTCTMRLRGGSHNDVPQPPIGSPFNVDLKVPAKSAVDAAVRIVAAFNGGEKLTSLVYYLVRIIVCVPWVSGMNHSPPIGPRVEDFTDGICLEAAPAMCANDGATCSADSECCGGICSESGACEMCRGMLEGCSTDAECCSGVCSINACGG